MIMTLKRAIKIYAVLPLVVGCLNVVSQPAVAAPASNSIAALSNSVAPSTNGLVLGSASLNELPVVSIASLTSGRFASNKVVHVRGAVSDQRVGFSILLRDETGNIAVRSSQKLELDLETVIDAWGFPVFDSAKRIQLVRAVYRVADVTQDTNNAASQKPANLPVITKASEVRELSPTQAGWEYPVKLRGVVTLANQLSRTYVQDDTAGIYLRFRKNRVKLKTGDVVEVEGVSNPGWCVPIVIPTKVEVVGTAPLPQPQPASLFQMAAGQDDGQWIEAYGVVREARWADRVLHIKLCDRDGTFMVTALADAAPSNLVDSVVRIRGVCVSQFNNKRQITGVEMWTPSADLIKVVEPAPADPFSAPTQPIVGLSQLHINALPRRVKVAGVVTAAEIGKSFFVQDADDGIQVFPSTKNNVKPGDRVEVSGYPAMADYGTVLRDAMFRIAGNAPEPISRLVLKDNPLDPQLNNLLVHVDAEVSGDPETDPEPLLPLQIGKAIFKARVLPPLDIKKLPARGSMVHLQGVYQVLADDIRSARAFQLIVPSGKDIQIISGPPIWSFQKTVFVIGGLGIVVCVALLWGLQLRRKVAEQTASLQQSEVKFRSLVEQSLVGVYVMQDEGFAYVNPRLGTIYGYSMEELTGPSFKFRQIVYDADWPRVEKEIKSRSNGETPGGHYTFRARRKDGAIIHVEVMGGAADYNGKPAILGTVMDVTERKEAETKLAEASNLLETLLDNSPDCIYFKDRSSRFVRYSKAFERLFNIKDVSTIKGKTDFDFFLVEHARAAFDDEQEIMRSGKPMIGKLELEDHADGRVTYSLTSKMPWRDAAGNIIGTFGISKDYTALREAEARLGYERDLFHTLLENFPDSIYFKDTQSRFVRVSRSKVTTAMGILMAQYHAEHPDVTPEALPQHLKSTEQFGDWLLGKTDFDTYAEDRARAAFNDEKEIMRTGEPVTAKIEKTPQADGITTWCITTKMPWRDKEGKMIGTFGVSKDITDLKKAESELESAHQRLVETSRLAGMAEVASDVLHNVGNVLNSVNVSCSLTIDKVKGSKIPSLAKTATLMEENRSRLGEFFASDPRAQQIPGFLSALVKHFTEEQSELLQELEQLLKHIEHIKQIVAMQQSYAKVAGVIETISPTQLVDDAIHINGAALTRHEVQVKCEFQSVPAIQTEKHRVLQILVNLIRNAKYALDESKRPDKLLTVRMGPNGADHVKIEVIDNGVGIPPENLTRIFGHGFTTRSDGHGFGLHSSAIAIKELGGSLTAHSDGIGKGAVFTLLLPERPPNMAPETK
jgi:PAS domain S-box-containing protein